jgi:hypothetical protein
MKDVAFRSGRRLIRTDYKTKVQTGPLRCARQKPASAAAKKRPPELTSHPLLRVAERVLLGLTGVAFAVAAVKSS